MGILNWLKRLFSSRSVASKTTDAKTASGATANSSCNIKHCEPDKASQCKEVLVYDRYRCIRCHSVNSWRIYMYSIYVKYRNDSWAFYKDYITMRAAHDAKRDMIVNGFDASKLKIVPSPIVMPDLRNDEHRAFILSIGDSGEQTAINDWVEKEYVKSTKRTKESMTVVAKTPDDQVNQSSPQETGEANKEDIKE